MIFRKFMITVFTVISLFILNTSFFGQTKTRVNVADVSNNGTNVSWLIKVPYESAILTVSAPNGKVFRREFIAGSIPTFSPITDRAEFYGEGKFNYEIVLVPILSPSIKDALAQSRKNGTDSEVEADFRKRGLLPDRMLDSGTFTVLGGTIILGNNFVEPTEPVVNQTPVKEPTKKGTTTLPKVPTNDTDVPVNSDQVIPDDLIVQGSACVGLDCVNNESFGFDTLRLKENNTRIGFDDTSSTGSFPANDWQLTANDSASGGANKFSIDDITNAKTPFTITAGAPTNSLFMDSSGRIGLGTSTPVLALHLVNSNTPGMRLEQNNSGGFTAQTWDISGNEANFFIRDVTGGSRLPFRIRPGAPTSSIDIAANGNVGFGIASPGGPLDVYRGTTQLLLLDDNGKLTINSSLQIKSGGIIFPDGTTQITAATGGGGGGGFTGLGSTFAQQIMGGEGKVASFSTITPTIDYNSFGIGTGGSNGFFTATYTIPYNVNLASQSATMVTYKIRYRDSDGTGTAANVIIELVAMDINTGGRASTTLFNSNTNAGTGFQTVTVCLPIDGNNFAASVRGMYLNVSVIGTAAQQADFKQIQIYKGLTCP